MKVIVRAPLLSVSGYGQHSRQVFEAVKNIPGVEIFTQIVQYYMIMMLTTEMDGNNYL